MPLEGAIDAIRKSDPSSWPDAGEMPFYLEQHRRLSEAFPDENISFAFVKEGPLTGMGSPGNTKWGRVAWLRKSCCISSVPVHFSTSPPAREVEEGVSRESAIVLRSGDECGPIQEFGHLRLIPQAY